MKIKVIIIILMIVIFNNLVMAEDLSDLLNKYESQKEDYTLCNKIGILYYTQNNFNKAKAFFLKSIILNNNYAEGYYNLGLLYYKNKEYNNALINFERAFAINKNDEGIILALINSALKLKKYLIIQKILNNKELENIINNSPKILNSIGIFYILKGDYENAYTIFSKALKINKSYIILNNIALTKYFLKDKKEAIKYLKMIKNKYKIINKNLNKIGGK